MAANAQYPEEVVESHVDHLIKVMPGGKMLMTAKIVRRRRKFYIEFFIRSSVIETPFRRSDGPFDSAEIATEEARSYMDMYRLWYLLLTVCPDELSAGMNPKTGCTWH
jgi:hypothetical protein